MRVVPKNDFSALRAGFTLISQKSEIFASFPKGKPFLTQQAIFMNTCECNRQHFMVPSGGRHIDLHIVGGVAGVEIALGLLEENLLL